MKLSKMHLHTLRDIPTEAEIQSHILLLRAGMIRKLVSGVYGFMPLGYRVIRKIEAYGEKGKTLTYLALLIWCYAEAMMVKQSGFAGGQITILDALLKLRQVCCDPYLLAGHALPRGTERAKMAWLCDTLPALVAEGRRILVFSQFTTLLHLLAQELHRIDLPHAMLTGETPVDARGPIVGQFQSGEGAPVLLISLKAGGVGLNLTAADTVIHVDPWWNPAVEQQATDRAHRLGQNRQVMVYKLVVAGSIELGFGRVMVREPDMRRTTSSATSHAALNDGSHSL